MNRVPVSLILSLALAGLAATTLPARGDVFTVTKTADTADGACDRDCSLREAVDAANAAAGVVVMEPGAAACSLDKLRSALARAPVPSAAASVHA